MIQLATRDNASTSMSKGISSCAYAFMATLRTRAIASRTVGLPRDRYAAPSCWRRTRQRAPPPRVRGSPQPFPSRYRESRCSDGEGPERPPANDVRRRPRLRARTLSASDSSTDNCSITREPLDVWTVGRGRSVGSCSSDGQTLQAAPSSISGVAQTGHGRAARVRMPHSRCIVPEAARVAAPLPPHATGRGPGTRRV